MELLDTRFVKTNWSEMEDFSRIVFNMGHDELMSALFADAQVKERIHPDEADTLSPMDWVALFKKELSIIRNSEEDLEVFRALLQMRYLATTALLAHARKGLDEAAA